MHNRIGHLWQNRFYSCPLGRQHFWRVLHYVETNPVRADIERSAWRYKWSSARAHAGQKDESGLLDMTEWKRISENIDWKDSLKRAQSSDHLELIRARTNSGRPLAGDSFLSKIEKLIGKRLRPLPAGRPKREPLRIEETKAGADNKPKMRINR
jgi:putative transposase